MTNPQDLMAQVGAAIAHAEKLQQLAEDTHRRSEERHFKLQKATAELLVGIEQRANGLGAQEIRLMKQIEALETSVSKLGPAAFEGAKASVGPEVRTALKGAAQVIGTATREITEPINAALTRSSSSFSQAEAKLTQAAQRFSNRALMIIAGTALGAFAVFCLGVWGAVAWLNHDIAGLITQRDQLAAGVDHLNELGGKAKLTTCGSAHRKCILLDSEAGTFGDNGETWMIIKGY
jgi:hypothetical protein